MKDRQLFIINHLLANGSSIDELSHLLNVSSRTIRNDVDDINHNLSSLSIPRIINRRGQLQLDLSQNQRQALSRSLEVNANTYLEPGSRQLDIIFSFLNEPKKIKIYEEQKKLQVSKSTMDKDMRHVRKFLARYSLSLNTEQGAEIVGAERNIRTMIQQLIVDNVNLLKLVQKRNFEGGDNYQIIINYLNPDTLKKTNKAAHKLILGGRYEGESSKEAQLSVLLAMWIKRLQQKQFIDNGESSNLEIANTEILKILKSLLKEFRLSVPKNEESYITFILKNFLGEKERLDKWSESELLTLKLIDYMSDKEGIDYRDSEQLYEQLNYHITAFLQRQENNIAIFNPLTEVLKNSYSRIYQDISRFFDERYVSHISDGEKAYITVYFSTYYEQNYRENNLYRVAVLCNYGEATGQLLAANITRHENIEVVAVLGVQDIKSLNKLNIDFVVKTIDKPIKSIPSFKMPPVPSKKDYQDLENFVLKNGIERQMVSVRRNSGVKKNLLKDVISLIESQTERDISSHVVDQLISIFKKHNIEIKEREVRPMIQDLLTDDKIQIHIEAKDCNEAIEKTSEPLLANESIKENYVEAMKESIKKYGPYIVIGPGIALAHARPEDGVSKLDVSVASLAKPIDFGNKQNDPVKIIFVLSAVDSYSHLNILKAIVNLINKPNRIEELYKAKTKDEFKTILFDEGKNQEVS